MMHMCDCEFCESCGDEIGDTLVHVRVPVKRRNKERAVIEAAKALECARRAEAKAVVEPEEIWAAKHYALRKAEQSLTAAVRALQAAEEVE